MNAKLAQLMDLEVPVIVRLGQRELRASEVLDLVPGAIIELHKDSEEELDLMINNKAIGAGRAVKVGENFGIQISFVGDVKTRIKAMSPAPAEDSVDTMELDADALAEQMLAGQL